MQDFLNNAVESCLQAFTAAWLAPKAGHGILDFTPPVYSLHKLEIIDLWVD